MKLLPNLLAVAVLAAISAPASAEIAFDVIGGSEVSFEGLLQADYDSFDNDVSNLNGSTLDGNDSDSQMRRAELVFKGKGPGMWNWVAGYDATAKKFLDANVSYKFDGFSALTVGQFKQPNSLEELSSTKNNDFISKAMGTNMQGLSRRVGISYATGSDNWTLTGSAFTRELTRNLTEGNGYGARVTFAPVNDSSNILHLGLSVVDYDAKLVGPSPFASNFNADDNQQFRVRPDADLSGKRLIDTGVFHDADRVQTIGVEGAWVHGPFKLQSEYMTSQISRLTHSDFSGDTWYVYGVWNLTGESWGYKGGVLTTPLPNDPASGMWQVGVRYDRADLNDGNVVGGVVNGVLGGKEDNWTIGVNYYWHSNFKFMLNYVKANSERYSSSTGTFVQDDPSIVELRGQIYW
jgi:phosphate-selective porin OprO/OprP